jgi:hypothetical protein
MTTRLRPLPSALMLVVVATAWRLAVLLRTDFAIDGDEGTLGLMALHISRGLELPVWFYGQRYMGALEAYVAAVPMALFGATTVVLKLTGLVFAVATVWFNWALARRVFGRLGGLSTGLYLALPPMLLSVWSLKMRGGYTSLLAMGSALLLWAHVIGTRGTSARESAGFGLLAGLCTWLNLLSFPFIGAAGLFLLARRQLVNRLSTLSAAAFGFLVGAAPLIVDNLNSNWETVHFLQARGARPLGDPVNMFTRHPAQLLGLVSPWSDASEAPWWSFGVAALIALGTGLLLWHERRSLLDFLRFGGRATSGAELYVLLVLLYLGSAALSGFAADPSARFSIVLYPAIAAAFGALVTWTWARPARATLTSSLVAVVIGFNLHSLWQHFDDQDMRYDGSPFGSYILGGSPDATFALLGSLGIDGLASDHWLRHVMAFESDDRIVPSPSRYGPHQERFRQAERIAWSTFRGGPDAPWMEPYLLGLSDAGVVTETHEVDGQLFTVLLDTGVPAREMVADSINAPLKAHFAIDRDPRTNWKAYERPIDSHDPPALILDLGARRRVRRLGFVFNLHGRPRQLGYSTSKDGRRWTVPVPLSPDGSIWQTAVTPVETRHLRFGALSADDMSWELNEVFVFEN